MPLKGAPHTAGQVGQLRVWIDAGAEWPDDDQAPAIRCDHWSLQPIHNTPEAGRTSAAADAFVAARLAKKVLSLFAESDRT